MSMLYLKSLVFVTVVFVTIKMVGYVNVHPTVWSADTFVVFCALVATVIAWISLKFVQSHVLTVVLSSAATLGTLYVLWSRSFDLLRLVVIAAVLVGLWALFVFGHHLKRRQPASHVPEWSELTAQDESPTVLNDSEESISLFHAE